jgi:hypothetical protein
MRRRPARLIVLGFGAFVFLGLSFLLAPGLSGSSAERGRVLDVLEAQAKGDAHAAVAHPPHGHRPGRVARRREPPRGAVCPRPP